MRRGPQQGSPLPRSGPKDGDGDPSQRAPRDPQRSSPEASPMPRRGLGIRPRGVDEGGSESGCSSIHSPQRCFSPMEDEGSSSGLPESIIAPQRRFTSPGPQRSPPRSPSVSSPGSSRSGSVADSQVMFESGESSDQRCVWRPLLLPCFGMLCVSRRAVAGASRLGSRRRRGCSLLF